MTTYDEVTLSAEEVLVAKAIALGKREILADLGKAVSSRGDVMPLYPRTFSELHDYVDANTYAGLCDDDVPDCVWNAGNEIQSALDGWLGDRINREAMPEMFRGTPVGDDARRRG